MSRLRTLFSLGTATLVLAAVVVLYRFSDQVFSAVPDLEPLIDTFEPGTLLLAGTAVLAAVAVVIVLRSRLWGTNTVESEPSGTESSQTLFREGSTTRGALGQDFDGSLSMATDYSGESRSRRETARRETVTELGRVAATARSQTTSDTPEAASEAIDTGTWTDDRRAAGLLADAEGPSVPLSLSLWDLLCGRDPFETGVDHAISAIESVYEREDRTE